MITFVFQKYPENFASQLTIYREICYFLIKSSQFQLPFLFINKTLRLNSIKTRTAMNAKISEFLFSVEARMSQT